MSKRLGGNIRLQRQFLLIQQQHLLRMSVFFLHTRNFKCCRNSTLIPRADRADYPREFTSVPRARKERTFIYCIKQVLEVDMILVSVLVS